MSLIMDEKYASMIAYKLLLHVKKSDGVHNFRCPLCGDSRKRKTLKRGYLIPTQTGLMMCCHNCSAQMPFNMFLKTLDESLYKSYTMEKFKSEADTRWTSNKYAKITTPKSEVKKLEETSSKPSFDAAGAPLRKLVAVKDLPNNHKCKAYVIKRQIPEEYWDKLYYAENYQQWINANIAKDKFEKPSKDDERLVIPFYTKAGVPYAYQGRYIGDNPSVMRYITIHAKEQSENSLLVYGLDKIKNESDNIYVLEGPIDSMFVANSLAAGGSSLKRIIKAGKPNLVFVFDNEPRNKDIVSLMRDVIRLGHKIVVWPSHVTKKDINLMVTSGEIKKDEINLLLKSNTYQGLNANLEFSRWKKSDLSTKSRRD